MLRFIVTVAFAIGLVAPAVAQDTVKVGVIAPFRGLLAFYGHAPGHHSRSAFRTSYAKSGGSIVGEVLYPPSTTGCARYIRRIKDARPKAVYIFTPVGSPSVSFVTTFASPGLKDSGLWLRGTGDTDELELPAMGDAVLGVLTAWHYSLHLSTKVNRRFVAALTARYGENAARAFAAVAAYGAVHAIEDVVAKHGANFDTDGAIATLRGWTGESPRGRITSDPHKRVIIQNQYIRRVECVGDKPGNVAFETTEAVKDPWKILNPQ
jgi:branched-chain amino acid transport system substrate-binding protein